MEMEGRLTVESVIMDEKLENICERTLKNRIKNSSNANQRQVLFEFKVNSISQKEIKIII